MRSLLLFLSLFCLLPVVVMAGGAQSAPTVGDGEYYIGRDGQRYNPSTPLVPEGESDQETRESGSSPYFQNDPRHPNADDAWDNVNLGAGTERQLPWYQCFLSCFLLPADFEE